MESSCPAGRIQVTEEAFNSLKRDFVLEERGVIAVKGKGEMKTYFLNGPKTARERPSTVSLEGGRGEDGFIFDTTIDIGINQD